MHFNFRNHVFQYIGFAFVPFKPKNQKAIKYFRVLLLYLKVAMALVFLFIIPFIYSTFHGSDMMSAMVLKEGENLRICAHNKRLLFGGANVHFNFRRHVFP